jgi:DNA replication protein DnaC
MIDPNLLSQLRRLKLGAMAQALEHQLEQVSTFEDLSFTERLSLLVDQELLNREHNKQARLVRAAKFKLQANLQDIDYGHRRNLNKDQVALLARRDWLERSQNLLVTGACGTGKTYIACAIAHHACLLGYTARYYRLSRLLLDMSQAKADGSYQKRLKQLAKTRLLIIDDWGLEALDAAQRHDLMEIMDDRHGFASTIVVSQLPTAEWYNSIGDNTLADAILDRLMHNAHRLELQGESMRKIQANLTHREHLS